jgi:hypothetical protein
MYLGLPITLKQLRLSQLQPVLDQAMSKLQGWQADLLNIGGRRELVKTVLSVNILYAAPQAHRIANVALHREYSLGIIFTFSQGRKDLYHV